MNLSEAEIQVLASVQEAQDHGAPTDRDTLEARATRFGAYKEDWSLAFDSLVDRDLLRVHNDHFDLTATGRPLAAQYAERANASWYHYQRFYPIAHASQAHSRFCERVYGRDLCQDGQTDMLCFDAIIDRLNLTPDDHILDLGCGAGGYAEYLLERTGARVTGIDNSAPAIATARQRTTADRDRLTFMQSDLNTLDLKAHTFDTAIALDSVYWITDLPAGLARVVAALKPGGTLVIVMEQRQREGDPPEILEPDCTPVARALSTMGLSYNTTDYTPSFLEFWSLARDTARALRADFARDGAEFISTLWTTYADEIFLPAIEAHRLRRFIYWVGV